MANYRKFIYASNSGGTLDGTAYATEAEKWAYIVTQASTANGKWYKTIIFREATNEIYNRGKAYGLSSADASRISALETWKINFDVASQILSGYSVAQENAPISASDDIKTAFGKVQKSINDIKTEIGQKAKANTAGQGEPSNAVSATGLYKAIEDGIVEAVARVVANADADFDTLKEVADWIKSDVTGAAKMQTQIATLVADANTNGSVAKAKADAQSYADDKVNALDLASNNANAVATDASGYVTTTLSQTNGLIRNESVTVVYGTFASGAQVVANNGIATVEGVKAYIDVAKGKAESSLQQLVFADVTIDYNYDGDLRNDVATQLVMNPIVIDEGATYEEVYNEETGEYEEVEGEHIYREDSFLLGGNSLYVDSYDTHDEDEPMYVEVAINGSYDFPEIYVTVTTATMADQENDYPTSGLAIASDVYNYFSTKISDLGADIRAELETTEKVVAMALKEHEDRITDIEDWVEW